MEDGKKVSVHCFLADQKIASAWREKKNCILQSMSNKLLLLARHTMSCELCKIAVNAVLCEKKYAPEVKTAKGLKVKQC